MSARAAGLCLAGVVAGAAGCAYRIEVPAQLPQPLLRPIPAVVGLYADAAFKHYVHHEELEHGGDWSFELGPASETMFRRVLAAQFQRVETLNAPGAQPGSGVQAVFRPAIEDFQFSTPDQTQTDFYEIWIKYHIHLIAPDGHELKDWIIAAYGKSRGRLIGGAEESLAAAGQQALRDAAAALALQLRDPGKFPVDDRGK